MRQKSLAHMYARLLISAIDLNERDDILGQPALLREISKKLANHANFLENYQKQNKKLRVITGGKSN